MTKEEILTEVIYRKSRKNTMPEDDYKCSMEQIESYYRYGVFSKVLSNASTTAKGQHITVGDTEIGYELIHAVLFCPPAMVFKLYTFIDLLLSQETTRTIIQTVVHLFQSDAVADETILNLAENFNQVVVSTFDLQYRSIRLATSTTAGNWPFITNYPDLVEKCLTSNCDRFLDFSQNLSKPALSYFLKFCYSDANNVSRELSLHPVHLTPDKEGNLPPSALIPFCSYQGKSSLLGRELPELNNMTVCDKFQSTILEGQLCTALPNAQKQF